MRTVTFKLAEEDFGLFENYIAANNFSKSDFIRSAIMDRIEDDLGLDEERIIAAKERAKSEKQYSHEEVWEALGV